MQKITSLHFKSVADSNEMVVMFPDKVREICDTNVECLELENVWLLCETACKNIYFLFYLLHTFLDICGGIEKLSGGNEKLSGGIEKLSGGIEEKT